MQSKQILLLGVITVAAVAGTMMVVKNGDGASAAQTAANERGALLPTLGERINDATSIVITKSGETITLQRDAAAGSIWGVADRGGYPADFGTVRELLVGLKSLEIEAPKTSKPANYGKLGVEDVATDSTSTGIQVKAGDDVLADLILGTAQSAGRDSSVYVRMAGEAQSWQARGSQLSTGTAAIEWMEREIMRIESERVRSALIQHPDGEEVKIERAARDSQTFVVANIPAGRLEKNEGVGNAVATALSYFSMEDVKPASEIDFTADPRAITTIRCYDGLVVEIMTAKVDELTWAKVACSFVAPTTKEADEADTTAEAPVLITPVDVDNLNAKVARWAFQVQEFKASALARRMEELLLSEEVPAEGDPLNGMPPGLPAGLPEGLPEGFDLEALRALTGQNPGGQ